MSSKSPDPSPSAEPTSSSVAALRAGRAPKKGAAGGNGGSAAGGGTWDTVKAVALTVVLFFVIRIFLFEAYRIPSGSMIPTLLVGDWLFVNKLAYGPHVPFTDINLPGYAEPKAGDVVVFVSPYQIDQPEDPTPMLVKRCVAVGGDTVWMRGGLFYRNGVAEPQPEAMAGNPKADGNFTVPLFQWQKQAEIRGSRFGDPPPQPTLDDWGPLVVPAGHLFMLGDNRYDSKDGRYWGPVPRENVRGRPSFVYYSYNADDSDRAVPWLTDIRWGRIGTVIR